MYNLTRFVTLTVVCLVSLVVLGGYLITPSIPVQIPITETFSKSTTVTYQFVSYPIVVVTSTYVQTNLAYSVILVSPFAADVSGSASMLLLVTSTFAISLFLIRRMSPSQCHRTKPHVHYRRPHEMLVVVGLLLVLTGYGLQFIKGAASVLPLTYDEIHAFTVVNEKMSELLAPYEYLKNFIIILDLLVLVTVFASAVTLRSRRIHWHKLLVIAAPVVGALDILLTMRYSQLTSEALIQLPTLGYSGSLAIIMDVQQKFGIPSPHLNMLIDIDSVIGLGLLVLAALTPKIVNEHKPSS